MAIKFQYNKTSLTAIDKQLKMRQKALPTLKNKESALRLAANAYKLESAEVSDKLVKKMSDYDYMSALWNEFQPELVKIKDVKLSTGKVAGVSIPVLDEIIYELSPFSAFQAPAWYADGVQIIKDLCLLGIESEILMERSRILDFARKKATQKVNLYEKVQIPGYLEAIRKIKRFMEDEENLSKASQKIVKVRHELEEIMEGDV